jgi:hypothetical protein
MIARSSSLSSNECADDCGHEVPISLYSVAELRKVVRFSLDSDVPRVTEALTRIYAAAERERLPLESITTPS